VADLREELAGTRQALERETVTANSLDAALARAESIAERLPAVEREPAPLPVEPRDWRVGERARSRTGGWEGRVSALDKDGRRATLEAGGMRVTVDLDDLEPALGTVGTGNGPGQMAASAAPSTNATALRLDRARSVASSLDLRGARVEEALEALARYLDDAGLAGLGKVTIIHGLGTGALRDAVRTAAGAHPLVGSVRAGERGEGGDGATIVTF
jgi:DNA mismatch repair protein MutS2